MQTNLLVSYFIFLWLTNILTAFLKALEQFNLDVFSCNVKFIDFLFYFVVRIKADIHSQLCLFL